MNRNHKNRGESSPSLSKQFKSKKSNESKPTRVWVELWITSGIDDDCIDFTEEFGLELKKNNFTTSQIRNVFGEVRRIQMGGLAKKKTDFLLLKPKMAYAAKKAKNNGATHFKDVIEYAHNTVMKANQESEQSKRFNNFCDFMEAIIAYHRAQGGKDN